MSFTTMLRETNTRVRDGANANDAIREAQAARSAGTDKTAAGAFCGPDDARMEIAYSGQTNRPLSDTLPTITVQHLNGGSAAANQIVTKTGGATVLALNGVMNLLYDGVTAVWREV